METAMLLTDTHILPEDESSTEGAGDTASSGNIDSDIPDGSDPDIPDYRVLYEAPLETVQHGSPQPGPSRRCARNCGGKHARNTFLFGHEDDR